MAIHEQRFFERTDGSTQPVAYGYEQTISERSENQIISFIGDNQSIFDGVRYAGIYSEPMAKSKPFRNRAKGREVIAALQPGDHLISWKVEYLAYSPADFCSLHRWCVEHGVRLHVIEMADTTFDSNTEHGRLIASVMNAVAKMGQHMSTIRGLMVSARFRAMKIHPGGVVPIICRRVSKDEAGTKGRIVRLELNYWAMPMLERLEYLWEVKGLSMMAIARAIKGEFGRQIKSISAQSCERYYFFYKGWKEMGFPNINSLCIQEVSENYKSKHTQVVSQHENSHLRVPGQEPPNGDPGT